jgi:hypothetical protein
MDAVFKQTISSKPLYFLFDVLSPASQGAGAVAAVVQ